MTDPAVAAAKEYEYALAQAEAFIEVFPEVMTGAGVAKSGRTKDIARFFARAYAPKLVAAEKMAEALRDIFCQIGGMQGRQYAWIRNRADAALAAWKASQ